MAKATRLTFFMGKGGVGKTTVSSAYALWIASAGKSRRTALISTDPAHSLTDVLEVKLAAGGPHRLKHAAKGSIDVWQIDAEARFKQFLDEHRGAITELIEQGTFLNRKEVDSFLETALPGLAEVSALLTLHDLLESGDYDEVVVDTAPIGHTLQLFRIPEQLARFVEFLEIAGRRDQVLAQHFGGNLARSRPATLERWEQILESLRAALNRGAAQLMMVTSAERFSLEESRRTAGQLADSGARITHLVLNRVILRSSKCQRCSARAQATVNAKKFLGRAFPRLPVYMGEDPGSPIIGTARLAAFGAHVFAKRPASPKPARKAPATEKKLNWKEAAWPADPSRLCFTLGKGGVGKTTVSAGIAFTARKAHPRIPVMVCSTDPAPSLDDVFAQCVGPSPGPVLNDSRLQACEIDAVAEFQAWTRSLGARLNEGLSADRGGLHVELSFEQEMMGALLDIVPPGVDEIFAVFKILDLLEASPTARGDKATLVIDMAPTGHALELLKTPERLMTWSRLLLKSLSAHRKLPLAQELGVEIAAISQRARELRELLADSRQSRLYIVMLAEPLPDRETGRLLVELGRMKLAPEALFLNRLLPEESARCRRCGCAREWQLATLAHLTERYEGTLYAIPDFSSEPSGKTGLRALTQELWQIEREQQKTRKPRPSPGKLLQSPVRRSRPASPQAKPQRVRQQKRARS